MKTLTQFAEQFGEDRHVRFNCVTLHRKQITGTTQCNRNFIQNQQCAMANTTYSGQSLFAGQKTDSAAYVESLWMNSNDTGFDAAVASGGGFTITGDSDSTVLVQFMSLVLPPR